MQKKKIMGCSFFTSSLRFFSFFFSLCRCLSFFKAPFGWVICDGVEWMPGNIMNLYCLDLQIYNEVD